MWRKLKHYVSCHYRVDDLDGNVIFGVPKMGSMSYPNQFSQKGIFLMVDKTYPADLRSRPRLNK